MRKVIQITDETGAPVSGHVFEAPDEEALAVSMEGLPEGRWYEVASEEDLVVSDPVDEPGQTDGTPNLANG